MECSILSSFMRARELRSKIFDLGFGGAYLASLVAGVPGLLIGGFVAVVLDAAAKIAV